MTMLGTWSNGVWRWKMLEQDSPGGTESRKIWRVCGCLSSPAQRQAANRSSPGKCPLNDLIKPANVIQYARALTVPTIALYEQVHILAMGVASTYCAFLRRDGQAESAWELTATENMATATCSSQARSGEISLIRTVVLNCLPKITACTWTLCLKNLPLASFLFLNNFVKINRF